MNDASVDGYGGRTTVSFVLGLMARGIAVGGVAGSVLGGLYGFLAGILMRDEWEFSVADIGAQLGLFMGGVTGAVIGVAATGLAVLLLVRSPQSSPRKLVRWCGGIVSTVLVLALLLFMFPPQTRREIVVLTLIPAAVAAVTGTAFGDALGRWAAKRRTPGGDG